MRVMIQLQEDAARQLQNSASAMSLTSEQNSEIAQLRNATEELGVTLQPVHPGQTHPLLATSFMVDVSDSDIAEKVINRLQQLNIVEAAYLKPEDQLP